MVLNWILIFLSWFLNPVQDATPTYKGGEKRLYSFISTNLIYPEYSKQNCLQGTVQISFQLSSNGKIFDSKVEKGFGTDLDEEALRVVRLTSGKWIVPAAFDTTQAIVIPINFSLREYRCDDRSADDIREALAAYRAREDLTKAVINFYDKKDAGTYSAADELKIENLKAQLGYNDHFFDDLLKQGMRKLKQGDREGACEDFMMIRKLGSDKSEKAIAGNCN